ncbi:MAG: hypothetical protein WKI04_09455 [Ferruginibacter sp.]
MTELLVITGKDDLLAGVPYISETLPFRFRIAFERVFLSEDDDMAPGKILYPFMNNWPPSW